MAAITLQDDVAPASLDWARFHVEVSLWVGGWVVELVAELVGG